MPDGVRWRRVLATSVVLACLVAASVVGSLWWLGPRPDSGPPPFPTRLATDDEQRDILALLFDRYFEGLPPPPPPPPGPNRHSPIKRPDLRHRPLVLVDTSLRFCAPGTVDATGECAIGGIDDTIVSPRWDVDFIGAPDIRLRFRTALVAANRRVHPQPMPTGRRTIPVAAADFHRVLEAGFWRAFYRRFPGTAGVIHANRAVVSADGREALIYVEHGCDGLCGTGSLILMSRIGGRWRITCPYVLWMS
jgi:hypothetical protein